MHTSLVPRLCPGYWVARWRGARRSASQALHRGRRLRALIRNHVVVTLPGRVPRSAVGCARNLARNRLDVPVLVLLRVRRVVPPAARRVVLGLVAAAHRNHRRDFVRLCPAKRVGERVAAEGEVMRRRTDAC